MIKLGELVKALPTVQLNGTPNVGISAVRDDSRQVEPGDLFVAMQRLETDSHRYIASAIERGARAVVGERSLADVTTLLGQEMPVPYAQVPDGREALAYLAAAWYGFPARRLRVIGVTGTDGKTTTVTLLSSILEAAGYRVGMVGSVSAVICGQEQDTGFHTTTPDAIEMQRYLAEMVAAEAQYAILESTSHGLAQHRVTACEYDAAVVTNITHEHLDHHGSFEAYREAKAKLFHHLGAAIDKGVPKVAVLNADDPSYGYLRAIPADVQLSYGLDAPADVTASDIRFGSSGSAFVAHTPVGSLEIQSRLVGRFNVYNMLAAIATAISQQVSVEAIQAGISSMQGVKGRMDPIDMGQDFMMLIDFAHTPNALEKALETVRTLTDGQVIVVFGCAGLRDVEKRCLMGEVAGRLADRTIMTAEDPRTESLEAILDQMAEGCHRAGGKLNKDYFRVPDRQAAIQAAVDMAQPGDVVVATGKGHEQSMCFGTVEYPWSDHEAARQALTVWLSRRAG